jgi:hypothetical protein
MSERIAIAAVALVAAATATAPAAAAEPARPWQLGVTGGFRAGGGDVVLEARGFAGYTHYFAASGSRALFVAPGATLGLGSVGFDDPRGVDGRLDARRLGIGPALRGGIAGGGRWPGAYAYLEAALLRIDAGTDSPTLVEAGGAGGVQLTLGVAAPEIQYRAFLDRDADEIDLLLALAPNTLEITFEELRSGGISTRRIGLALGYSL